MAQTLSAGVEFLVNTQTDNYQGTAVVTTLASGGFVVTWNDFSKTLGDASLSSIKAQLFDAAGNRVGSEFLVNTHANLEQDMPRVASLKGGGFVVSWNDRSGAFADTSDYAIAAQVFNAAGVKVGAEFLVNTRTTDPQMDSAVLGLSNGGFVVAWANSNWSGGPQDIRAQLYNVYGDRVGSEVIVTTATTGQHIAPVITALADGRFVITWQGSSAGTYDIYGQMFSATGAKSGTQFQINTTLTETQSDPAIAGLANGGFVVTWTDESSTGDFDPSSIKAQIFNAAGAKVGAEFLVNTQAALDQLSPAVAGLADGGFVITWTDASRTLGDSDFGIKAQVYDAAGNKVMGEFLVNANTEGFQGEPSVTGLPDGRFVISWSGSAVPHGDGAASGVMARTFNVVSDTPSAGNDSLTGSAGNDVIDALAGYDTINGLGGHDRLNGGAGNDSISGGTGNDTLDGGAGRDTILAGDGDDLIYVDGTLASTGDVVDGGDGNDTVVGTQDLQGSVFSNVEHLKVMYSTVLNGTAAQFSSFQTIDDNGALLKLTGAGTLDLTARALSAVSLESAGTGNDITGSVYNDTLTGNYLDTLHGGAGNDRLTGGKMYGDAGNDTLYGAGWGGDGDDAFRVYGYELGPQYFDGGDGNDAIYAAGSLKNFNFTSVETLWVRYDTERLNATVAQLNSFQWIGSEGAPIVLTDAGTLDLSTRALTGISLYAHKDGNTITGSQYRDVFMGQGGRYIFHGGGGNDELSGGGALYGEGGNDRLAGNSKDNDTLDGGDGNDTIVYGGGAGLGYDVVNGGAGEDTLQASGDISGLSVTDMEVLTISRFTEFKATSAQINGFNTILQTSSFSLPTLTLTDGGTLDLTGKAFDAIHVKASDAGNNITGDRDHDTIYGGAGNDTLNGGGGDDYLNGGAGDDLFVNSAGSNSLVGGTGRGVDVAQYDGARVNYDVWGASSGNAYVYDLRTGDRMIYDRLSQMEYIVFADGYLSLTAGTTDGNDMPERISVQSVLAAGTEDTAYVLSLSQLTRGFGDPENDVLGIDALSADHGAIVANSDGSFTLVPQADYNGPVTLSYQVTDGHGGSTSASLSLALAAVNDAPSLTGALADLADGTRGVPYSIEVADLLAGYSDAEDDALSVTGLAADHGAVTDNGDGTFVLTPEADYAGQVTLSYTIDDGHGGTVVAEQTVLFVAGDQSLTGTGDADTLNGGAGNDTLRGLGGNDSLNGGAGNDSMYGGLGDDVYTVAQTGDKVIELAGQGIDTVYALVTWKASDHVENVYLGDGNIAVYGNALANTFTGNIGNNTLTGAEGNDTLSGGDGNDKLDGGADHDSLSGGAGNDNLLGGDGSDSLDGGTGNDNLNGGSRWDTLRGGEGDDILDGGADNDQMYGGTGNDTYVVDHVGDRVYEIFGEGTDTVKASISYSLTADVEILNLTGTGDISGTGNGLINSLNGNSGNNGLNGGLGNDSLYGWDGNDSLSGGNDHDRLSGGNGSDTLVGGHGNDQLGGGAGADSFVFSSLAVNGHDHLVDFVHGVDRLVFKGADYGFAAGHGLTDAEFTVGVAAVGAAAQFVWDAAGRHLWFDADGDGAGAIIELALIDNGATVTKDDLSFI